MADTDLVTEADLLALVAAIASQNSAAAAWRDARDARILHSVAIPGGTSPAASVGAALALTGTATAAPTGWGSRYAAFAKLEALVTTAATSAVAGARFNTAVFARGVVGYPNSGWRAVLRGGPATGLTGAGSTHRFFLGLRGSASAPTDVNPSSLANTVGIGWDAGDTNVQLFHNDASGTATRTNLGVARPTTDRTTGSSGNGVLYRFETACDPAGASIAWSLTEEISSTLLGSGTISSADIPAATTGLSPQLYASVGGTSSIVGVSFAEYFIETGR